MSYYNVLEDLLLIHSITFKTVFFKPENSLSFSLFKSRSKNTNPIVNDREYAETVTNPSSVVDA
jgi:hypothetical protein